MWLQCRRVHHWDDVHRIWLKLDPRNALHARWKGLKEYVRENYKGSSYVVWVDLRKVFQPKTHAAVFSIYKSIYLVTLRTEIWNTRSLPMLLWKRWSGLWVWNVCERKHPGQVVDWKVINHLLAASPAPCEVSKPPLATQIADSNAPVWFPLSRMVGGINIWQTIVGVAQRGIWCQDCAM